MHSDESGGMNRPLRSGAAETSYTALNPDVEGGGSPVAGTAGSLASTAGRSLGILERAGDGHVTEQQLRDRGQTASEAERNLVTQQAEELAMAWIQVAGRGLFCLLCCIVLPLCIAIFAVTLWAAFALDQDTDLPCDTPVRAYVWGFIILLCWVSWCQNVFVKFVLRYDHNLDGSERPLRVQVYQSLFLIINVGWNIAGLVWVSTAKTCAETAPHMYASAKVLVFLQLTVYILLSFVMAALVWMVWAIRHGQITTNAAPDGFVDSLEVMKYSAKIFDDDQHPKECSICYDAFATEEPGPRSIVRTPCGHVFHKQCLGGWMASQRTCPICRADLVDATSGTTDPEANTVAP